MLTDFVAATQALEAQLPLRNDRCASRFFLHPQPTDRVFLFFHGITAAPYQFDTIGQMFHAAGDNVLIPLMPGHGVAGDWNAANPPPLPEDIGAYQEFALTWLRHAQTLGQQVIVGGLSAGGGLAAWLGVEKASEIDRVLLFAPYLSNATLILDLITNLSDGYFAWVNPSPDWNRIGYPGFKFPAMRIFPQLGREILERAQTEPTPPTLIFSTETDIAVNNGDHRDLYESVKDRQPVSWYYCFSKDLNIPHAMMAPEEGNQWTNVMNRMVKAYVESTLTWAEIEEIAYRMTDGKTFPAVVAELDLADRCSPDMPTLMTMIDKRQIVIDRNPNAADMSL
jgi:pimeloyl-ACP methyl ester carboxylesterase